MHDTPASDNTASQVVANQLSTCHLFAATQNRIACCRCDEISPSEKCIIHGFLFTLYLQIYSTQSSPYSSSSTSPSHRYTLLSTRLVTNGVFEFATQGYNKGPPLAYFISRFVIMTFLNRLFNNEDVRLITIPQMAEVFEVILC